jgi:hypothetical protein
VTPDEALRLFQPRRITPPPADDGRAIVIGLRAALGFMALGAICAIPVIVVCLCLEPR